MAAGGPGLAFETWEASKYPATRQSPGRPSALPRVVLNPSNLPAKAIPPGREGPRIAQGRGPRRQVFVAGVEEKSAAADAPLGPHPTWIAAPRREQRSLSRTPIPVDAIAVGSSALSI